MITWNTRHAEALSVSAISNSSLPAPVIPAAGSIGRAAVPVKVQSAIGQGLKFVGEISGSETIESLFVEGSFEGRINLPGSRVTVGRDGRVTADITAGYIVVMGKVNGNITGLDRVDIRGEGAVTGDASAPRVCIEDGAFFRGKLDVSKSEPEAQATADLPASAQELPKAMLVRPEARSLRMRHSLQAV